jgi:BirA family biotin operon repressor/biotin-[acetyl-CoA-carboxylase] ligase
LTEAPLGVSATAPVVRLAEVDSTNLEARRRAEAGDIGPVWIRADVQTAGRGRRGRSWLSPEGAMLATYLGATHAPPGQIALLSFAAGLAVCEALEANGVTDARLKWPNDVLRASGKICGILIESSALAAGGVWFAVGVGVNLAHAPGDAGQAAAAVGQGAPTADAFLAQMAPRFAAWAAQLDTQGFAPLRAAWLARATGLGGPVRTQVGADMVTGVFDGLSENGALLLRTPSGVLPISAGDVFFPDQSGSVP